MREFLALLKKDLRATRNLGRIVREHSSFKVAFILVFASSMIMGLWMLFAEGFFFLDTLGGIGLMLVSRLFALFFLALGVMLTMSGILTSYTTFFRSDETAFLFLKPLDMGQIAIYKALQSAVYSSWAFFFTIIPFIGAYAWHEKLSIFFSLVTLFFSIPLVLFFSGVGSLICLIGARWLPRGRRLLSLVMVLAVVAVIWGMRTASVSAATGDDDATLLLSRLIPGLRVASNPLLPSWWVAEGIMALARGQWARGLMLWSVLFSNVLVMGMLIEIAGRACFYKAWQRVNYSGEIVKRSGTLLGSLERVLAFLRADTRALILKDIRTFLRDPAQWSQGLIFFGLLGLYFLNLRNLHYHMLPAEWRNVIVFLNVFSVSAVMCSLGSRFVYPQLSLEGHGFWIIGLSPVTMRRVLVSKFALAVAGMMAVSVTLMYISTRMLLVPPPVQAVALGVAVAMSLGISGLSTGLGALFLDLKQPNPAAIVSGFGGTLNLVLSLFFICGAVFPFGFLFHLRFAGRIAEMELQRGLAAASLWVVFITLLAALLPLFLGGKSLKNREY
jgi:ABC-2 type transport system permease protein